MKNGPTICGEGINSDFCLDNHGNVLFRGQKRAMDKASFVRPRLQETLLAGCDTSCLDELGLWADEFDGGESSHGEVRWFKPIEV